MAGKVALRYRASLDLWWVFVFNRFWIGPFASAKGAAALKLRENYSDKQRTAWRRRP